MLVIMLLQSFVGRSDIVNRSPALFTVHYPNPINRITLLTVRTFFSTKATKVIIPSEFLK